VVAQTNKRARELTGRDEVSRSEEQINSASEIFPLDLNRGMLDQLNHGLRAVKGRL